MEFLQPSNFGSPAWTHFEIFNYPHCKPFTPSINSNSQAGAFLLKFKVKSSGPQIGSLFLSIQMLINTIGYPPRPGGKTEEKKYACHG